VAGGSGYNPQQTPRPVEAATIRTAAEVPFGARRDEFRGVVRC
jgi:hypothetical protein